MPEGAGAKQAFDVATTINADSHSKASPRRMAAPGCARTKDGLRPMRLRWSAPLRPEDQRLY
jgi:hypothetical protein